MNPTRRALLRGALSLGAATAAWTAGVHQLFVPPESELDPRSAPSPRARALVESLIERARTGAHRARLRAVNPEWDLIERFVATLSLADVALADRAMMSRVVPVLDGIGRLTEGEIDRDGFQAFLLPYGRVGRWRGARRSLFVDGEVAVVHGARRLLADDPWARDAFRRRVAAVVDHLEGGPILCGESYPDECWTFCNTAGLVALRMAEVLDGDDHSALRRRWEASAREHLIDPETGLLTSAFTWEGRPSQPPEGSSLWWSAHALRVAAPDLAREQYALARQAMGRTLLGFGWATEWAPGAPRTTDIDSGGVVPGLEASAGSSGWALVAARSFGDRGFHRALLASVGLAGFPEIVEGRGRLIAGNPVGDAILTYSMVQGPLWDRLGAA